MPAAAARLVVERLRRHGLPEIAADGAVHMSTATAQLLPEAAEGQLLVAAAAAAAQPTSPGAWAAPRKGGGGGGGTRFSRIPHSPNRQRAGPGAAELSPRRSAPGALSRGSGGGSGGCGAPLSRHDSLELRPTKLGGGAPLSAAVRSLSSSGGVSAWLDDNDVGGSGTLGTSRPIGENRSAGGARAAAPSRLIGRTSGDAAGALPPLSPRLP
eukprot:181807-Chlamydomonas_euryale.AAC.1